MGLASRGAIQRRRATALFTAAALLVAPLFLPAPAQASTQGTVTGSVYNDANGNGAFDGGEQGLSNRTVFADYDNDSSLDAGEPSTLTSGFGTYSLSSIDQGAVRIAIVLATNTIRTTTVVVTNVVADSTVSGVDIGTFVLGTIAGTIYQDTNGNGVRNSGESGVPGIAVYVDANTNGIRDSGEETRSTNSSGAYSFGQMTAGSYTIRIVAPGGVTQTNANPVAINVVSGTSAVSDFGLYAPGSLSGIVYQDLDGNGTRDGGEPGYGGAVVFFDADADTLLDAGETSTSTDGSGAYSFANLGGGTYSVVLVVPNSFSSTSPNPISKVVSSGSVDSGADFGISDTGVLSGQVFTDADSDGVNDADESGAMGRTLFIDHDNDGSVDPGEPTTTSDATGHYFFTGLSPGSYRVRMVVPAGTSQTTPNPAPVTVAPGAPATGVVFGLFVQGVISGNVYVDDNGDATRNGAEIGTAAKVVYLDQNNNNSVTVGEPSTTTDSFGNYSFTGLAPGNYRPKVVVPGGSVLTTVLPGVIVVTSGTAATSTHFGLFTQGSINGVLYNDLNANGTKDVGDAVLSNRTVFLDSNDNAISDTGEPSQVTNGSGAFTFAALGPGGYRVRVLLPANTIRTTPLIAPITMTSGATSSGHELGLFTLGRISGTVYSDGNANGVKGTGENGLVGRTVYIDADGDEVFDVGETSAVTGSTGVYNFAGLEFGSYSVRLVTPTGQTQTSTDPSAINVVSATAPTAVDFGLYLDSNVTGTVYDDVNGNGTQGAGETGIAGVTVFIDADTDGVFDVGESSAVTNSSGLYAISTIKPGSHRVRVVMPSGTSQTSANPNPLTPPSGGTTINVHFGLFRHATITGFIYDDTNGNAALNSGEPMLSGRTVYLDSDGDSVFDPGETSTVSQSDGSYSFTGLPLGNYRVRIVEPTGWQQTSSNPTSITPTSGLTTGNVNIGMFGNATLSGTVFEDLDGDGVRDAGELGISGRTVFLDTNNNNAVTAGEPTASTDANGDYTFNGLGPGTFRARVGVPGDSTRTSPNPPDVVTTSSAVASGNDFAVFTKATITGTVYNDLDGDGIKDASDGGVGSRTVYIDADDDGIFDTGETNNVTNAAGTFTISNLAPGSYRIRVVVPAGTVVVTPTIAPIVPQSGSINSAYLFGIFASGSISGTVYNDGNGNGVKNSGETGIARTVYIDADDDGIFDTGETSIVTTGTGTYSFTGLLAGTYKVRLVGNASSVQTSVAPAPVGVVSGTASTLNDIGVYAYATLGGVVYDDTNGNGSKATTESGRVGITVYLDTDGDSTYDAGEPSTITDFSGGYSFSGLTLNSYRIRLDLPTSIAQTSTVLAAITPVSGSSLVTNNIGVFVRGIISGTVFGDSNGNASLDTGEAGVANVVVYLDNNSNSQLNAGEPSVFTDADGNYSLTGLAAGNFKPRAILPTGTLQTTPSPAALAVSSATVHSSVNFGAFTGGVISGSTFLDADGNGTREGGEAASAGRIVYLDNDNDAVKDAAEPSVTSSATGAFSFTSLAAGTYRLRVVVPATMLLTSTVPAPVVVVSGTVRNDIEFGLKNSTGGTTTTTTTTTIPTTTTTVPAPLPPPPPTGRTDPITVNSGYWMTNTGGNVYAFGEAKFLGEAASARPTQPIVGIGPTASGKGYHQVALDGGIFAFGDAKFHGSMGGQRLNQPIVGMASTPTGDGYWMVASDGGIFAFGDARFFGSTGSISLNKPIVGMSPTASGRGYWLVASDGGIFAFGDAGFFGSTGSISLNKPIVGMANSGDGGYWLVASDGGVFAFGSAKFLGSMGGSPLNRPIVSMRAVGDGSGYWMFASDGGVFAFGSARFRGGTPPTQTPIVN